MMTPIGGPIYNQVQLRWRTDDGSESAASWHLGEDIGITTDGGFSVTPALRDVNIRLRILTGNSGDSGTVNPQLEYSHNSGAWTNVTGASSVVRASASANFADNASTTRQIHDNAAEFVVGKMDEADGTFSSGATLFETYVEHEWCFQIRSADVSNGDTVDLKATASGTDYGSYTVTARANITSGATRRIFVVS